MKTTIILLLTLSIKSIALAQTYNETISREMGFERKTPENTVIVDNINGNVRVFGYEGDQVVLSVEKIIQAKTEERLQEGKMQVQLGVLDRADTLIFYTDGLCAQFIQRHCRRGDERRWGYQCMNNHDTDCDCQEMFHYKMNFTLKVPFHTNVQVRTINEGDIMVENLKGVVTALNVNGSIQLSGLTQKAYAHTINGNVDITYDHNPDVDCRFYTLNGDINANFQKGLAADLSFESFHGNFFTNVDLEALPPRVVKSEEKQGVKYKVTNNHYKVGKGGVAHLDFETFNGNVYLKEKIN